MKNFVSVLLLAVASCLGGCATGPTPQEIAAAHFGPLPKDHQQQIKNFMSQGLKDPYSAVYRFEIPRRGYVQDGPLLGGKKHFGWVATLYVNSKNSFGAYTGEERYIFIFSEGVLAAAGESFELGLGGYVP